MEFVHKSIMLEEVIESLAIKPNGIYGVFWIFQSLRKNAGNGNISESPEVISFISRASLSSIERTTENIWDAPFILVR